MCGGLFNDSFSTNSLLSLLMKEFLKSMNSWQSYRQKADCLTRPVSLGIVLFRDKELQLTDLVYNGLKLLLTVATLGTFILNLVSTAITLM